jgi:hypothetical protein
MINAEVQLLDSHVQAQIARILEIELSYLQNELNSIITASSLIGSAVFFALNLAEPSASHQDLSTVYQTIMIGCASFTEVTAMLTLCSAMFLNLWGANDALRTKTVAALTKAVNSMRCERINTMRLFIITVFGFLVTAVTLSMLYWHRYAFWLSLGIISTGMIGIYFMYRRTQALFSRAPPIFGFFRRDEETDRSRTYTQSDRSRTYTTSYETDPSQSYDGSYASRTSTEMDVDTSGHMLKHSMPGPNGHYRGNSQPQYLPGYDTRQQVYENHGNMPYPKNVNTGGTWASRFRGKKILTASYFNSSGNSNNTAASGGEPVRVAEQATLYAETQDDAGGPRRRKGKASADAEGVATVTLISATGVDSDSGGAGVSHAADAVVRSPAGEIVSPMHGDRENEHKTRQRVQQQQQTASKMSGWLTRRAKPKGLLGGSGRWELSYFRLTLTAIRFFKTTESTGPSSNMQGEIDLSKERVQCVVVRSDASSNPGGGSDFNILVGAKLTLQLRADSVEEMQRWCDAITETAANACSGRTDDGLGAPLLTR